MAGLTPFNNNRHNTPSNANNPFNMIDDYFDEAFNEFPFFKRNLAADPFKVDVQETDDKYLVEAELPGVNKEDIDLNLNDYGKLSIAVNREENVDKKDDADNYVHRERRYDSMQRTLYLAEADPDGGIHARLEDGVLKITIEKKEQEQSDNTRQIEIE